MELAGPGVLTAFKNGRLVREAGGTVRRRFFLLPRFMPYMGVEIGILEVDGGYTWSVKFARRFADMPTVVVSGFGYWELPIVHIKIPLPHWLHKIDREHFEVATLPLGKYKLAYVAIGRV